MEEQKTVWEFVEMVKAGIYGASKDRNLDTSFEDSDDFARFAYEVYLVIERRITENDAFKVFGVPRHGKEKSVKTIAREKYKAGFESEKSFMRALYLAVPTSSGNNLESNESSKKRNGYQYDGDSLYY